LARKEGEEGLSGRAIFALRSFRATGDVDRLMAKVKAEVLTPEQAQEAIEAREGQS